jgi:hypothetical protein
VRLSSAAISSAVLPASSISRSLFSSPDVQGLTARADAAISLAMHETCRSSRAHRVNTATTIPRALFDRCPFEMANFPTGPPFSRTKTAPLLGTVLGVTRAAWEFSVPTYRQGCCCPSLLQPIACAQQYSVRPGTGPTPQHRAVSPRDMFRSFNDSTAAHFIKFLMVWCRSVL